MRFSFVPNKPSIFPEFLLTLLTIRLTNYSNKHFICWVVRIIANMIVEAVKASIPFSTQIRSAGERSI